MNSRLLIVLAALIVFSPPAHALTPDEIVLVVNSKVPESRKLAEFYARQRKIPDGRILELDLPFPQEDVAPTTYDEQVVPQVRAFLTDQKLKEKVTCVVTFWGVPLRIQHRQNTPGENEEIRDRDKAIKDAETAVAAAVKALEAGAAGADPTFKAGSGEAVEQLAARAEAGVRAIRGAIGGMTDVAQREKAYDILIDSVRTLAGRGAAVQEQLRPELLVHHPQPATREEIAQLQAELTATQQTMASLQNLLQVRENREKLLEAVKGSYGRLQYLQALRAVRTTLDNTESTAAFDSELALLWLDNYPKQRWIPNFLHHGVTVKSGTPPRILMVMRIDGPSETVARRIITDSILAETEGLTGAIALDARGNHSKDSYAEYDNTIRSLAGLLKAKTKLDVRLEDTSDLFPSGSQKGVALYCGWYSLRNYVPGFQFQRGAVGFHIASSELVSLRNPGEKGWVTNLLRDGCVSSLGPVSEPYLHSFPKADEFFPLLLTGRLTLAEVYWKTNPLGSWMNTCIGDPLYKPYAKNPAMRVIDLPPELQKVFGIGVNTPGPDRPTMKITPLPGAPTR